MAPEVMKSQVQTTKADIFSIGSILFNLLTLTMLFNGRNKAEVVIKNKRCILPSKLNKYLFNYSDEVKSLLLSMVEIDPENRPSASEALKHPWFEEISDGID